MNSFHPLIERWPCYHPAVMAWLAEIDTRARRRPPVLRWPYIGTKWALIALGVYLALGLAWQGNGLGVGLVVAAALALIKGIVMARKH